MGDALFLVRFGEIGIKSQPVRRRFQQRLGENILRGLRARGAPGSTEHAWGRVYVRAPEPAGREVLSRTFGVVSFSPVVEAPVPLPELAAFAAREAARIPENASFAVRPKRTGEVGYTSTDLAVAVGAAVLEAHRRRGLRVDLETPDAEIFVEVREGRGFVGFERIPGPGGLPVGTEGTVVAWLGGPRDALAAWATLRRGCAAVLVAPAQPGADALAARLAPWAPGLTLLEVDPAGLDRALVLALLEGVAARTGAAALVLGDDFQAAMATTALDRLATRPVFRPLVAPDPSWLADAAAKLGLDAATLDADPLPAARVPEDPERVRAEAAKRLAGARSRSVEGAP